MNEVLRNIEDLEKSIPDQVKLVPISKTMPNEKILEAWSGGFKVFGENKVQELQTKYQELPKDIEWHMVGHLQSNKVKYIAPFVHLIHGVDSMKLLRTINKEGQKNNRLIKGLFQMRIASEETKFGLERKELEDILLSAEYSDMRYVKMIGVMGMATFTDDKNQIKKEFDLLKSTFDNLKQHQTENCKLETISMGMSGDYELAIESGSTMIRVGSSIFGSRNYN